MKEKSEKGRPAQAATQRMESAGLQSAPPSVMEELAWALSWLLVFQKAQHYCEHFPSTGHGPGR